MLNLRNLVMIPFIVLVSEASKANEGPRSRCNMLMTFQFDRPAKSQPQPVYHDIEIGTEKFKLLKTKNSRRSGDGALAPIFVNADGSPCELQHASTGTITAVVDATGALHFFRNSDGKKLEASIPPELTPEGREEYVSRIRGGVPAGASTAVKAIFADRDTIAVEDSMIRYDFVYDHPTESVRQILNPAELVGRMVEDLEKMGDPRILKTTSAGARRAGQIIDLPANAESGLTDIPGRGNIFFLPKGYATDLNTVASVSYRGTSYKFSSTDEPGILASNFFFSNTGRSDGKMIWLRNEGSVKIGAKDHSVIRVIALPK